MKYYLGSCSSFFANQCKKHQKAYLRYEYKVELNIFYDRETEKAKLRCPVLCG